MKSNRTGFTLIELLVCVGIVVILAALIIGAVGGVGFYKDPATGKSFYNVTNTANYRCVKTYTMTSGGGGDSSASTSKRVDLKEIRDGQEVGIVQTFTVDDDYRADVYDSGTLYGQFEPNKFYSVTSIGFRREGWNGFFPLVKSVSVIPDPTVKKLDNPIVRPEVNDQDFSP